MNDYLTKHGITQRDVSIAFRNTISALRPDVKGPLDIDAILDDMPTLGGSKGTEVARCCEEYDNETGDLLRSLSRIGISVK